MFAKKRERVFHEDLRVILRIKAWGGSSAGFFETIEKEKKLSNPGKDISPTEPGQRKKREP